MVTGASPGRRRRLDLVLEQARGCTLCAEALPHAPRPVLQVDASASVVIIGQAPGAKVHASGVPWQDASGAHLSEWLGVSMDALLDPRRFAIVPMGFCFPGRRAGGDRPPRPECAPTWHGPILDCLRPGALTLLVGQYAVRHYLGRRRKATLTDTVRGYREYLPEYLPLPHPSWRSRLWMEKNPWFARELLPELRRRVRVAR